MYEHPLDHAKKNKLIADQGKKIFPHWRRKTKKEEKKNLND